NATNSFRLDVGFYLTASVGSHNTYVNVRYEGTLNGNYDSTIVLPQPLPPNITSLSPSSGIAGTAVTISGLRFGVTQGSSTVTFNGTAAGVLSWSDTSVQVSVPSGTSSGPVIITAGGVSSNAVVFNVISPPPLEYIYLGNRLIAMDRGDQPLASSGPPSITTLSPTTGTASTAVTITGNKFDTTALNDTVSLNGSRVQTVSAIATSMSAVIPTSAG